MDIIVHKESNVFPMIPAGAAHYDIIDPEVFAPEPKAAP